MKYDNYLFDLYGTLVDIHTDEQHSEVWERLAVFYGYYGGGYKRLIVTTPSYVMNPTITITATALGTYTAVKLFLDEKLKSNTTQT